MSPPLPPNIITPHLRLRPLSSHDVAAVISLRTNPRIFYWKTPDTEYEAALWLQDRLAEPLALIYVVEIMKRENDGTMEPVVIGLTGAHRLPEVGYIFDPAYWGKGYATEALRGWLGMYWARYPDGHHALLLSSKKGDGGEGDQEEKSGGSSGLQEGDGGAPYLVAETGTEGQGKASGRVLQKCGFVFEKQRTLQEGEVKDGTVFRDCWRMEKPDAAGRQL